jgi:hypothetical protein
MTTQTIAVVSVLINARPETVFPYISELPRHGEWAGGSFKIEATSPGPSGVGSTFRSVGDDPFGKNIPNELRVTEYQPFSRFGFVSRDARLGDVSHQFTLTPQDGGTNVERKIWSEMSPLTALLVRLFVTPSAQSQNQQALQRLKARVEQGAA